MERWISCELFVCDTERLDPGTHRWLLLYAVYDTLNFLSRKTGFDVLRIGDITVTSKRLLGFPEESSSTLHVQVFHEINNFQLFEIWRNSDADIGWWMVDLLLNFEGTLSEYF